MSLSASISFTTPGLTEDNLPNHLDKIMVAIRGRVTSQESPIAAFSLARLLDKLKYGTGDAVKLTALLQELNLIKKLPERDGKGGPWRWYVDMTADVRQFPSLLLTAAWQNMCEHSELTDRARKASAQVAHLEDKLAHLEIEASPVHRLTPKLAAEVQSLLDRMDAAAEAAQAERDTASRKLEELEQSNKAMSSQLDGLRAELSSKQQIIDTLQQQLNDVTGPLADELQESLKKLKTKYE